MRELGIVMALLLSSGAAVAQVAASSPNIGGVNAKTVDGDAMMSKPKMSKPMIRKITEDGDVVTAVIPAGSLFVIISGSDDPFAGQDVYRAKADIDETTGKGIIEALLQHEPLHMADAVEIWELSE